MPRYRRTESPLLNKASSLFVRSGEWLIRLRFTLLFLVVMIAANSMAGVLDGELPSEVLEDWGIGQESVWAGDLARLLTGTFLSHDLDMLLRQFVFASAIIGYTEWRSGSGRTALAFFGLDISSTLLLLTTVWLHPSLADVTGLNDVGMSMGGFGLVGLAIAGLRRRIAILVLVSLGIAAKIAIDFEPLTDTGHVIALGLGFLVGLFLHRGQRD